MQFLIADSDFGPHFAPMLTGLTISSSLYKSPPVKETVTGGSPLERSTAALILQ